MEDKDKIFIYIGLYRCRRNGKSKCFTLTVLSQQLLILVINITAFLLNQSNTFMKKNRKLRIYCN